MKKIPRVMKKALDASRAANDRLKDAEAGIVRAGKRRDRATRALDKRLERLQGAFLKSGGVTVVIQDNGSHGIKSVTEIFVDRIVCGQNDKSFRLDPASKQAKRLYAVYGGYVNAVPSLRCVSLFTALVKQLCVLEVLSDDDRLVVIDERYFVKDDNGRWFGVLTFSFEEV